MIKETVRDKYREKEKKQNYDLSLFFLFIFSKMMILSYTDGSIRVIVTTGNLIEMDWENTTQG